MLNRLFSTKLKITFTLTCLSFTIAGCESTVDFGKASPSEYKLDEILTWHDDIKPDNTYFAYSVEIVPHPELETMLSCNKGTGTPFSDLKQTHGLILSPATPSTSTQTNTTINLAQAVVVFDKNKTNCTTKALNRHLTPYQTIKDTNYQVNRVNYSSNKHEVDYEVLISTISVGTQLATGTPFVFNEENSKTIQQATNALDSALSQWMKDNRQSYTTTPSSLLAYSNGVHVPYKLSIPIKYTNDGETTIIGHVIVKPKFLRTVWLNRAESVNLPVIKYSDVKTKDLSNNALLIEGNSTYNNYIDSKGKGQLSLSDITTLGQDIDWSNPEIIQVKAANETLTEICKGTKTILSDVGLHEYDQHLLLVQRLEESELWQHRLTELPEVPAESNKSRLNKVRQELNELTPKENIDLSSCLDYSILIKQEYPVITQEAFDIALKKVNDQIVKDKSHVEYFDTEVGQAFNTQETRNGNELSKHKPHYINTLQNRLFLPDNATVEFQDNRDYQPENWQSSSDNKEILTSEVLMSRFWDMNIFLYGCYLQPKIRSINGSEIDTNAVRALYFTRSQHIGSITFQYSGDNTSLLQAVTLDPVYNNSINLTQVESSNFESDTSCMKSLYPKIKSVLGASKSTAIAILDI